MCQHGVIDSAAYNPESGRRLKRIRVFFAVERDDEEPLANASNEKHGLFRADTMFARHPRKRGVHFGEAGAPQQPVDLSNWMNNSRLAL
jgi:hypothetical protein